MNANFFAHALADYVYLNWGEEFWSPELENTLLAMFLEPSIFEISVPYIQHSLSSMFFVFHRFI